MRNKVDASGSGLRLTLLVAGALGIALMGLGACAQPAQELEIETSPAASQEPATMIPAIDDGVPANLETASFAMG